MRKCIRCGAQMQEGFTFTGGGGNVLRKKGINLKAVIRKRLYVPNGGEVSIYVDDDAIEKLTM